MIAWPTHKHCRCIGRRIGNRWHVTCCLCGEVIDYEIVLVAPELAA